MTALAVFGCTKCFLSSLFSVFILVNQFSAEQLIFNVAIYSIHVSRHIEDFTFDVRLL